MTKLEFAIDNREYSLMERHEDIEKKERDFDRYSFDTGSYEISVLVDFKENKISGDMIVNGKRVEIFLSECVELLNELEQHEIKRDFSSMLDFSIAKLENCEQVIYEEENKEFDFDFDSYYFVARSQNGTKGTSVIVDFKQNIIYGDETSYGSMLYEIGLDECIQLLNTLEQKDIIRDFSCLINQYEK